ncbi:MAG TPA: BLUF domain-containing protein [Allosphingosinicella sp.]|jgi:hypothetical protein
MKSLLYVSQSLLKLPDEEGELSRIIEVARQRNAELSVTGALVFTQESFAQVLEGPSAAVDTLMESIVRDPRHRHVKVVRELALAERLFAKWTMAYSGPSLYVERHIRPLLFAAAGDDESHDASERLLYLIEELTRGAACGEAV